MKERIRGFFAGVRRFFGKTVNVIAVVVVVGFILAWLVGWPGVSVYFAHRSGLYEGVIQDKASRIVGLRRELDAAAEEQGALRYELDAYKQVAGQLQAQLATMMPIGEVFWCTNMPPEPIAQDKQVIVLATAEFVAKLSDVDIAPAGICVVIVGITGSEVRGEMYVPVQRVFSSGASDPLTVVWQVIPGEESEGQIIGYYSWITREWHPAETAP